MGAVSGTGTVTIAAEQYSNYNSVGVPLTITEVPLTTTSVIGGRNYTISVPTTSALENAAINGVANLQLESTVGNEVSIASTSISVPGMTALSISRQSNSSQPAATVIFRKYRKVARGELEPRKGPAPPICTWGGMNTAEVTARVGELHVAAVKGADAAFVYRNEADSKFGVAYSDSPAAGFTADGTASVGNSMTTTGALEESDGFLSYVDSHFYREEYSSNTSTGRPTCDSSYKVMVTNAVGDVFPGVNKPAADPWGGCQNDPNGLGYLAVGETWSGDRGHAETYSAGVTLFGVGLSAETGYTSDITIQYANHSKQRLYFCGDKQPQQSSVLYEN